MVRILYVEKQSHPPGASLSTCRIIWWNAPYSSIQSLQVENSSNIFTFKVPQLYISLQNIQHAYSYSTRPHQIHVVRYVKASPLDLFYAYGRSQLINIWDEQTYYTYVGPSLEFFNTYMYMTDQSRKIYLPSAGTAMFRLGYSVVLYSFAGNGFRLVNFIPLFSDLPQATVLLPHCHIGS